MRTQQLTAEKKTYLLSCIQIYFLIHNAILFPRLNYLLLFRHTLFKSIAGRERNRSEPEKQILSQMQKCMPNRRPTCHTEVHTILSVFETLKSHSLSQRACSGSELESFSRNIHEPNRDLAYMLLLRIQRQTNLFIQHYFVIPYYEMLKWKQKIWLKRKSRPVVMWFESRAGHRKSLLRLALISPRCSNYLVIRLIKEYYLYFLSIKISHNIWLLLQRWLGTQNPHCIFSYG